MFDFLSLKCFWFSCQRRSSLIHLAPLPQIWRSLKLSCAFINHVQLQMRFHIAIQESLALVWRILVLLYLYFERLLLDVDCLSGALSLELRRELLKISILGSQPLIHSTFTSKATIGVLIISLSASSVDGADVKCLWKVLPLGLGDVAENSASWAI